MRTAHCSGRLSCHACPSATHALPSWPPVTHAPCHTCPPAMHMSPYHAHPLPCMHPCHTCMPLLPCMPPTMHTPCHACMPLLPHTPPAMHAPSLPHPFPWTDRHLWKHYLRKLRLRAVNIICDQWKWLHSREALFELNLSTMCWWVQGLSDGDGNGVPLGNVNGIHCKLQQCKSERYKLIFKVKLRGKYDVGSFLQYPVDPLCNFVFCKLPLQDGR